MEKLLVLGTVPLSVEYINMAKARGIYTIVTDYLEPEKSPAKLISDEYWMISTGDLDELEKKCREEGVTAVITGISENNCFFMAQLCERLGLPCWCTPQTWDAIQKKDQFKKLCRENRVPIAEDYFLSNPPTEEELNEIQFPVVVKPVDLNSDMGLSYCYSKEDVIKGCEYARSLSSSEAVVVEKMLTGDFYMSHFALAEGNISQYSLVASFVQPGIPERCHSFTVSVNNMQSIYKREMYPAMERLLKAAGCKDGVCWVQNFLDEEDCFRAFEMGYRFPGDMTVFPFQKIGGFDGLAWLLDTALGAKHTSEDLPAPLNEQETACVCAYLVWNKLPGTIRRIEGIERIKEIPGTYVRSVSWEGRTAKEYELMMVISFSAENQEQAIDIMKQINTSIKIYNENGENMLFYFDDFDHVRRVKAR